MFGRSNVGKSSLVNFLFGRKSKKVALTSSRPGKTQSINFYNTTEFTLVDMPGFGYSAVTKTLQKGWTSLIKYYLKDRTTLKGCILCIDIRRGIMPIDHTFINWLQFFNIPFYIILTKIDTISKSKRQYTIKTVKTTIQNQYNVVDIIPISIEINTSRNDLTKFIRDILL